MSESHSQSGMSENHSQSGMSESHSQSGMSESHSQSGMSVSAAIANGNFEALKAVVEGKDNEVFDTTLFDSYDDKRCGDSEESRLVKVHFYSCIFIEAINVFRSNGSKSSSHYSSSISISCSCLRSFFEIKQPFRTSFFPQLAYLLSPHLVINVAISFAIK